MLVHLFFTTILLFQVKEISSIPLSAFQTNTCYFLTDFMVKYALFFQSSFLNKEPQVQIKVKMNLQSAPII